MIFLNAILLAGIAAAAAPLIIHLLHRSKVRVVQWGAMQFLLGDLQRQSRRMRWQQWLLLAVRCCIPALLAIAMARPAARWLSAADASGLAAQQFVALESSPSTRAAAPAGQIRPTLAAAGFADALVLDAASQADQAATPSRSVEETLGGPAAGLAQTLQAAALWAERDVDRRSQIAVVSDFQRTELTQITAADRSRLRAAFARAKYPPELVFVPVAALGEQPQTFDNVSAHFEPGGDDVVGLNQLARLSIVLTNHGETAVEALAVRITLDGRELASWDVDLPPRQQQRRSVPAPAMPAGLHRFGVDFNRDDVLPADNAAEWAVRVLEPQPVLIVGGKRDPSQRVDGGVFVQLAVRPPDLAGGGPEAATTLPRLFEPIGPVDAGDANALNKALDRNPQVIVLCDVPRLPDAVAERVLKATENGLLMVFAGPDADSTWYSERLFDPIDFRVGLENDPADAAAAASRSLSLRLVESVSLQASSVVRETLRDVDIALLQFRRLRLDADAAENASTSADDRPLVVVETVATLAHRDTPESRPAGDAPLLDSESNAAGDIAGDNAGDVVIAVGRSGGRQLLLAGFELHPDATDLPLSPGFVPMIQKLLFAAALDGLPARNETTLAATAGPSKATDTAEVARQLPPWESDLTLADRAAAARFAADLGGRLFDRADDDATIATPQTSPDGAAAPPPQRGELWRYVLIGLLAALFAELLLQQRLARGAA